MKKDVKVALFLVNGFEEVEAFAPVDLMRRAEIAVDTVSITGEREVESSRKVIVLADKIIGDINFDEYEMFVLPGGPGTGNYMNSEILKKKLKEFSKTKKLAAICAAPTIFSSLGILEGKRAVCFPACEEQLVKGGAVLIPENVVKDGNIITSKAAGTAIDFGLKLVEEIKGKEKSEEIKEQIYYK